MESLIISHKYIRIFRRKWWTKKDLADILLKHEKSKAMNFSWWIFWAGFRFLVFKLEGLWENGLQKIKIEKSKKKLAGFSKAFRWNKWEGKFAYFDCVFSRKHSIHQMGWYDMRFCVPVTCFAGYQKKSWQIPSLFNYLDCALKPHRKWLGFNLITLKSSSNQCR